MEEGEWQSGFGGHLAFLQAKPSQESSSNGAYAFKYEKISLFLKQVKLGDLYLFLSFVVSGIKVPGIGSGPACFPSFLLFFYYSLFCYVQTPHLHEKLTLILTEIFLGLHMLT